jgi:hypothetical protein
MGGASVVTATMKLIVCHLLRICAIRHIFLILGLYVALRIAMLVGTRGKAVFHARRGRPSVLSLKIHSPCWNDSHYGACLSTER